MDFHDLLVHTSLKDTLDLVDNIKDKWGTADLDSIEKGVLSRWVTSARACVTEYVLLLDVKEEQPLKPVLRNYRFTLLANSHDDPGLRETRALPRHAYERITSCLETVLSECGSVQGKKYQHPSDLPFFDRSYHSVLGPEHRKSYRSPSLAFLAIDYHLDLIGGQLFRLGKKDILKFVQTVVKPCSQATALAYWCDHGGWQQLRYKLSISFKPAWSSQNEKYDEQLAIFQDLERLFRVVQAGIVHTPDALERYIVKSLELAPRILTVDQLMSRPEEPNKHGLDFFSPTKSLLIKKGFFGSSSSLAPHANLPMSTANSSSISKDRFDRQVDRIKEYCALRGEDITPWLHDLHEKVDPYFQTSLPNPLDSINTRREVLKALDIMYERIERGETIPLGYDNDPARPYSQAFAINKIVPVCRLDPSVRRAPLSLRPFIPDMARYAALENGTMTWDHFFVLLGTMREWYAIHHHQEARIVSKWSRDIINEKNVKYGDYHLEGAAESNSTLFKMILVCEMLRNGASLQEERFEPARLLDESIKLQPIENVVDESQGRPSTDSTEVASNQAENCFFPIARAL